jgi:hypothetical protein
MKLKSEAEVKEMALALCDMGNDPDKPPGLPQCAEMRIEGMMLALAWALGDELPGKYPEWFEHVRTVSAARRAKDSFCE